MYASERKPKPPVLADLLRQVRQQARQLSTSLDQLAQLLEDGQQSDYNGPEVPGETTAIPPHGHLSDSQKRDLEAYKLCEHDGVKQSQVAVQLNAKYHAMYSQGQVSKMIRRARAHLRAMGLQPTSKRAKPVQFVDPAALEMGSRTDGLPTDGYRSKRRPTDA